MKNAPSIDYMIGLGTGASWITVLFVAVIGIPGDKFGIGGSIGVWAAFFALGLCLTIYGVAIARRQCRMRQTRK